MTNRYDPTRPMLSQRNQSDTEHIYYNIRIDNPIDGFDNGASESCVYEKQTQNILERQSDYEMAIDHWNIRANLPIMIVTIQQGTNTNINLMPFSVNFRYTTGGVTTNYQTFLTWVPDFAFSAANPARTLPLPKAPNDNNGIQDLRTSPNYYYCNSYQRFIDIINTALSTSYTAFNAAHGGVHGSSPWVQYDAVTGLISMIAETSYATGAGGVGTNKAFVSVDALLYKYIDTMNAQFNGYNQANGADYNIEFQQLPGGQNGWALGNHYAGAVQNPLTDPPAYIIMQQESDTRYLWSNIKQILITSSSISVRNEYMPYIEFPQQITATGSSFNQPTEPVISYVDYNYASPSYSTQASKHRDIFYQPLFYRWMDLLGDNALNNINIEVFFVTEDGFRLPINIPNKASVSMDFVFRKKK
jgi:hypothetical protein